MASGCCAFGALAWRGEIFVWRRRPLRPTLGPARVPGRGDRKKWPRHVVCGPDQSWKQRVETGVCVRTRPVAWCGRRIIVGFSLHNAWASKDGSPWSSGFMEIHGDMTRPDPFCGRRRLGCVCGRVLFGDDRVGGRGRSQVHTSSSFKPGKPSVGAWRFHGVA